MKRTLALILFCLMLLPSCSGTTGSMSDGSLTSNDSSAAQEEETLRTDIPDNLPDMDFAGKAFRIATQADKRFEITADEYTGEAENDAVYDRNSRIVERFNCTIEPIIVDSPHDDVITVVTSGSNDYELTGMMNYKAGPVITEKVLLNWYDMPHIAFEQPWYVKFINESSTISGKMFTATGDLALTSLTKTIGMFANHTVCENAGYTEQELYTMVENGTWTIDTFQGIVDQIYTDTNGDGQRDPNDLYGYGGSLVDDIDLWLPALQQPVTGRANDGSLTIELICEKSVSILEKLNQLIHNTNGSYVRGMWEAVKFFSSDRQAFAPLLFSDCFASLRNMESSYSILPVPKWDEAQQGYRSTLIDEFTAFGALKTLPADDYEFVGMIFEVLNAESYKTVYPVYYDTAMKGKYSTDPQTKEMIDLIMDTRSFDIGITFGRYLDSLPYCFRDLISANSTDLASVYASKQNVVAEGLKTINEIYK